MNAATETDPAGKAGWKERLTDAQREAYERIPEEMDYVCNPDFERPDAEKTYFGDEAPDLTVPQWSHFPAVANDEAPRKVPRTQLKPDQEKHLFLKYNYACYRLAGLIEQQRSRPTVGRAREMVRWYDRAMETRAALVRANMALVLAMAKRTRIPNVDFPEMISEGNMALLRSVEKFDVARGFKFSTYACRAILKSFHRMATRTARYRQHFPTEYDPELERSDYDVLKHDMQRRDSIDGLREVLARNKAKLTEVEHKVVMERFALNPGATKKTTLKQVGKMIGLTNERVRQIQNAALAKLKTALSEDYLVV